ncbi:hypothetical protein [Amycolatopsis sp. NBC_00438]|uniref:hypothetical protein n=1 Tax=Amycolatopsis sp. NBC_00438 TaxID=2903558 RepID=UPI002E230F69
MLATAAAVLAAPVIVSATAVTVLATAVAVLSIAVAWRPFVRSRAGRQLPPSWLAARLPC